jgi:hypothetical protein
LARRLTGTTQVCALPVRASRSCACDSPFPTFATAGMESSARLHIACTESRAAYTGTRTRRRAVVVVVQHTQYPVDVRVRGPLNVGADVVVGHRVPFGRLVNPSVDR